MQKAICMCVVSMTMDRRSTYWYNPKHALLVLKQSFLSSCHINLAIKSTNRKYYEHNFVTQPNGMVGVVLL